MSRKGEPYTNENSDARKAEEPWCWWICLKYMHRLYMHLLGLFINHSQNHPAMHCYFSTPINMDIMHYYSFTTNLEK